MADWRSMDDAPRDGTVVWAILGEGAEIPVLWEKTLFKAPPPFLERPADYKPELLRLGRWRRARNNEVIGWATSNPEVPVLPYAWIPYEDAHAGSRG